MERRVRERREEGKMKREYKIDKNKYEIDKTKYKIEDDGVIVYRVRATREIVLADRVIKPGDYGGYVESEDNLAQNRNCWIMGDTVVRDNAKVCGEALVIDSVVKDDATICDFTTIVNSLIGGNAEIYDRASILGSLVADNAVVAGKTRLYKSSVWRNAFLAGQDFLEKVTIENCQGGLYDREWAFNGKYILTRIEDGEYEGMYRLFANRDINNFQSPRPIRKGQMGGIVSSPYSLSRVGDCWIGEGACVMDNGIVSDYAYVGGNSVLHDNVVVGSSATVIDSELWQNAFVAGKSRVLNSVLGECSRIFGPVRLGDLAGTRMSYKSKDSSRNLRATYAYELESQAEITPVKE